MPPLRGVEIRGERSPPGVTPATRGRGMFATSSFAPGELVAEFDSPLAVFPASRHQLTHCNWCLDPSQTPVKPCTGCAAAAYCSKQCQRQHWTRVHKFECKHLRVAHAAALEHKTELPTPVRTLMYLGTRYERDQPGESGQGNVRRAIETLESNTVAYIRNSALWDTFKMQAVAACEYTGRSSEAAIKTTVEILCRVHTNSFDRTDRDTNFSGLFLDATLAMVNHACIPNATVAFMGQRAFLHAVHPIAPGDELTISYIETVRPVHKRQHALRLYNFACQCLRCTRDLDVYEVCQLLANDPKTRPAIDMNARFTFLTDLAALYDPPALAPAARAAAPSKTELARLYDEAGAETETGPDTTPEQRLQIMRHAWRVCAPLVRAKYWAVEPLATVLRHAAMYFNEIGNHAHALAVALFSTQHIDPYKFPEPFMAWRVKSLFVIAETLPLVVPVAHPGYEPDGGRAHDEACGRGAGADPRRKVHPAVLAALSDLMDGGMYEVVLRMALHYGPMSQSDAWPPLVAARRMMDDVRQMSGQHRESITQSLDLWEADPLHPQAKAFFDGHFIKAVNTITSHTVEVLADLLG